MDKTIGTEKLHYFDTLGKKGKKLFFIGAPIFIIGCISLAVFSVMSFDFEKSSSFTALLAWISAIVFLIGAIILFSVVAIDQAKNHRAVHSLTDDKASGYFNIVAHVILLLCTFGIWNLIWIYRTTSYLNILKSEPPRSPVKKLLLYIFIPFYSYYWIYKSAKRIDDLAQENGKSSNIAVICLILAIFVGIVPPIVMQYKINEIAES